MEMSAPGRKKILIIQTCDKGLENKKNSFNSKITRKNQNKRMCQRFKQILDKRRYSNDHKKCTETYKDLYLSHKYKLKPQSDPIIYLQEWLGLELKD